MKSNRDAIGAAVTLDAGGRRQTKYLQAGSGFLSQHTKEMFFGVGSFDGKATASIRWPSGLKQEFAELPVNHRFALVEGREAAEAKLLEVSRFASEGHAVAESFETPPKEVETWLLDPVPSPEFSLQDLAGKPCSLRSYRGGAVLLNFWTTASPACRQLLRQMERSREQLAGQLSLIGLSVDATDQTEAVRRLATEQKLGFPNLLATPEVSGVYNIVYRYLFDRRRDLGLPTSFLVDSDGFIVKVYQGLFSSDALVRDAKLLPMSSAERAQVALPFEGTLHQDLFQRNDFTYGVAFYQRGFLKQAEAAFQHVIAQKPDQPEAYYNLGTLYLRRDSPAEARKHLEKTVQLRPQYPEAWNNLGMLAAQEGHPEEAIRNFQRSLSQRPDYAIALLNLGNVHRRQGSMDEAEAALQRALAMESDNPDIHYGLGMFYVKKGDLDRAREHLEKAVEKRPGYPEALNNLGVLSLQAKDYAAAEQKFQACIAAAPNFDQAYMNLARTYVAMDDKDKARAALRSLLRVQPEHVAAKQALEMLN